MTAPPPRVALFADCFHEVNGVALTCRELVSFAERRGFPLFSVHAGPATALSQQGSVTTLDLRRGPLAFAVESDFSFDPCILRYRDRVVNELKRFHPDAIHVTGPTDVGILGVIVAHQLRVPLVASWHTNIHEYGARRMEKKTRWMPERLRQRLAATAERRIFEWAMLYYRLARMILAPNAELVSLIAQRTGKPVRTMRRGVDTTLYSPHKRRRSGDAFILGYVGRLTPEKNVRVLADIEQALLRERAQQFRFLIVGRGSELGWLAANMRFADFPGVLKGEVLARAYAEMDAFVFPSRTDTYGNVIQEAMASGVPCVVTDAGGPRFLVKPGAGFVCATIEEMAGAVLRLMKDPRLLQQLRRQARAMACHASWDNVFEDVYEVYRTVAASANPARNMAARSPLTSPDLATEGKYFVIKY